MNIRILLVLESYIYYLKSIRKFQTSLEDNLFQAVEYLQKKYPSFREPT